MRFERTFRSVYLLVEFEWWQPVILVATAVSLAYAGYSIWKFLA